MATLVLFLPATRNGFVAFDDLDYIKANPHVREGLTPAAVAWAFTSVGYAANWHPLTWLSHQLDVSLFGMDPAWHHAENALLHALNAVLLLLLLRALTGELLPAALAAALFAFHPLRVESVAWAAQRKDLLGGFFWIVTLLAWVRWLRRPRSGSRVPALVAFALGLMSKPTLVALPALLLVLDLWPFGRIGRGDGQVRLRRALGEKMPFFMLAACGTSLALAAQTGTTVYGSLDLPPGVRLANAAVSVAEYLRMTVWPRWLAVFYPHPLGMPAGERLGAALVLIAALTILAVRVRIRIPALLAGWGWYLVSLAPMSGIVQVGWQARADRYTYLPHMGLLLGVVWGVREATMANRSTRRIIFGAMAILLAPLFILTRIQIATWRDDIVLFRHALQVTGGNWFSEFNLGSYLLDRGEVGEAVDHFRRSLADRPGDPEALNSLGVALFASGRREASLEAFREAARADAADPRPLANLGRALIEMGRQEEAAMAFREALTRNPANAVAREGLRRLGRSAGD